MTHLLDLVNYWEIATNVRINSAIIRYTTLPADSHCNVITTHHVEEIIQLVYGMTSISPRVCADSYSL